jgi:hypothetical protein
MPKHKTPAGHWVLNVPYIRRKKTDFIIVAIAIVLFLLFVYLFS